MTTREDMATEEWIENIKGRESRCINLDQWKEFF